MMMEYKLCYLSPIARDDCVGWGCSIWVRAVGSRGVRPGGFYTVSETWADGDITLSLFHRLSCYL